MKKKVFFAIFIPVVSFVVVATAALTAFLIFREKHKRDEEELERYLDTSIQ